MTEIEQNEFLAVIKEMSNKIAKSNDALIFLMAVAKEDIFDINANIRGEADTLINSLVAAITKNPEWNQLYFRTLHALLIQHDDSLHLVLDLINDVVKSKKEMHELKDKFKGSSLSVKRNDKE